MSLKNIKSIYINKISERINKVEHNKKLTIMKYLKEKLGQEIFIEKKSILKIYIISDKLQNLTEDELENIFKFLS